jgi:hypothetical protein
MRAYTARRPSAHRLVGAPKAGWPRPCASPSPRSPSSSTTRNRETSSHAGSSIHGRRWSASVVGLGTSTGSTPRPRTDRRTRARLIPWFRWSVRTAPCGRAAREYRRPANSSTSRRQQRARGQRTSCTLGQATCAHRRDSAQARRDTRTHAPNPSGRRLARDGGFAFLREHNPEGVGKDVRALPAVRPSRRDHRPIHPHGHERPSRAREDRVRRRALVHAPRRRRGGARHAPSPLLVDDVAIRRRAAWTRPSRA